MREKNGGGRMCCGSGGGGKGGNLGEEVVKEGLLRGLAEVMEDALGATSHGPGSGCARYGDVEALRGCCGVGCVRVTRNGGGRGQERVKGGLRKGGRRGGPLPFPFTLSPALTDSPSPYRLPSPIPPLFFPPSPSPDPSLSSPPHSNPLTQRQALPTPPHRTCFSYNNSHRCGPDVLFNANLCAAGVAEMGGCWVPHGGVVAQGRAAAAGGVLFCIASLHPHPLPFPPRYLSPFSASSSFPSTSPSPSPLPPSCWLHTRFLLHEFFPTASSRASTSLSPAPLS
ncbi:unnamed protein product [Closterium sp. Naga37s-1]|nr:unnamed protein product [Closterium sp. Naga37s-1]